MGGGNGETRGAITTSDWLDVVINAHTPEALAVSGTSGLSRGAIAGETGTFTLTTNTIQ